MNLISHGISDVGRRRPLNEDSFLSDDGLGLYIVADGVGGHAKGEVASAQAVEEMHGYVRRNYASVESYLAHRGEDELFAVRRMVESAAQSACYMVFGLGELDPDHRGMSTTMSAVLVAGKVAITAQVGDSRVYQLRAGRTQQLTEDHTLVNYKLKKGLITPEEAKQAPDKNVITRAVGHRDYVQVDTCSCDVAAGDRFLLCTDGLYTYVEDDEIAGILGGVPLESAAQAFVDTANDRGGRDNITVLLVEILETAP